MKHVTFVASISGFLLLGSTLATAGTMDDARFALHVTQGWVPVSKGGALCSSDYAPNVPCSQYVVTADTGEAPGPAVFLVLGQGGPEGVSMISCGIDYTSGSGPGNGIDSDYITWTSCAGSADFPNGGWPGPGGGIRIIWSECQTEEMGDEGVHAVAGAFYVYAYSEDVLRIIANNQIVSGPEMAVRDCNQEVTDFLESFESPPLGLLGGRVHFGGDGSQGYTPCGVVATEPTTWGRIKNAYE